MAHTPFGPAQAGTQRWVPACAATADVATRLWPGVLFTWHSKRKPRTAREAKRRFADPVALGEPKAYWRYPARSIMSRTNLCLSDCKCA